MTETSRSYADALFSLAAESGSIEQTRKKIDALIASLIPPRDSALQNLSAVEAELAPIDAQIAELMQVLTPLPLELYTLSNIQIHSHLDALIQFQNLYL